MNDAAKTSTDSPASSASVGKAHKNALRGEEFFRKRFVLRANPGDTAETLGYSEWWAAVAPSLSRHDVVFVLADDESWEAECRVEAPFQSGADVTVSKLIKRTGITNALEILGDGAFVLEHVGGSGWCVRRVADGHLVVKGHGTQDVARREWQRTQPKAVA